MRLTCLAFLSAGMVVVSPFAEQHTMGQAARMFGNATTRVSQDAYDTPIPAQIREGFNRTVLVDCEACSVCAFTVLEGERRISIFAKKFIIVDLQTDDVGDVSATLVFEDMPHPFLLRMDDMGGGKYELRTMAELPGLLGEGFVRRLQSPAYRYYWL